MQSHYFKLEVMMFDLQHVMPGNKTKSYTDAIA